MLIISSYLQLQCGNLCGDLPAPPELHGNLLYQNGQVNYLLFFYLENLKSSIYPSSSVTWAINWGHKIMLKWDFFFTNRDSVNIFIYLIDFDPLEIVELCALALKTFNLY